MDSYLRHKKLQPNQLGQQTNRNFDVLIPFIHFEEYLKIELQNRNIKIHSAHTRLIITEPLAEKPLWAQDWWPACYIFDAINEAIVSMKAQPHLGIYYQTELNPLVKKIESKIKTIPLKRIKYKVPHPFNFKFYAFTIFQNKIIICDRPYQRFPFGWHEFEEDKINPPNRAYLKLWELFTVQNIYPLKKDNAIEIGASPGGWSWVLSPFCNQVHTFDRAPLDQKLKSYTNIKHTLGDAFKIPQSDYADCNWFFSDLICTPEKLLESVNEWIEKSPIKNYVCTIKFKGDCDFDILKKFLEIPNSQIIHLYQNKNEVTWIRRSP